MSSKPPFPPKGPLGPRPTGPLPPRPGGPSLTNRGPNTALPPTPGGPSLTNRGPNTALPPTPTSGSLLRTPTAPTPTPTLTPTPPAPPTPWAAGRTAKPLVMPDAQGNMPRGASTLIGNRQTGAHAPITTARGASTVPRIAAGSIVGITTKDTSAANAVFTVVLSDGTALIVKTEQMGAAQAGLAGGQTGAVDRNAVAAKSSIMAMVTPGTNTVALDMAELQALHSFKDDAKPKTMDGIVKDCMRNERMLVKMIKEVKWLSTTNEFNVKSNFVSADQKKAVTDMYKMLRKNTQAWDSLGRVGAGDYFIGNTDRIDWGYRDGERVKNWGNMIFEFKDGKIKRALGYDIIDMQAKSMSVYGTDQTAWYDRFGQALENTAAFPIHAAAVMKELTEQRTEPLGLPPLGQIEANAYAAGLRKGCTNVADGINKMLKEGQGVPSGLVQRMRTLKWLK